MGATVFTVVAKGVTAQKAWIAVQRDYYDTHPYSGTVAEKESYIEIPVPDDIKDYPKKIIDYSRKLIDDGDERVDDKWGPAGCLKLLPDQWLFFGWASC